MKYVIIIITMCFSLNAGAQEVNKIINNDKINQILAIDNSENTDKEQWALNMYKKRLDLLSYKERQLKVYENSLNGMKMQLEFLQADMENKQIQVNEKEIALLKKELMLKEKENDLKQLEEKLSQIDNIQMIRNNTKLSTPSLTINDIVKNDSIKTEMESIVKVKKKVRYNNKNMVNTNTMLPTKNNIVLPSLSGLEEMKKNIINGVNMFNQEK